MSTSTLLWSMVVRGWSWTTGIGALLGAGYGIVLLATMMVSLGQLAPDSPILQLALVIVYGALASAIFGAVVAGLIGLVAGPIGGLLCGAMTRVFFFPLHREHLYRMTARIAAALYGMVAIVTAVRLISTSGLAPTIETTYQAVILYVIPALIGGAAGIFISPKVTDWYIEAFRGNADTVQGSIGAPRPAE